MKSRVDATIAQLDLDFKTYLQADINAARELEKKLYDKEKEHSALQQSLPQLNKNHDQAIKDQQRLIKQKQSDLSKRASEINQMKTGLSGLVGNLKAQQERMASLQLNQEQLNDVKLQKQADIGKLLSGGNANLALDNFESIEQFLSDGIAKLEASLQESEKDLIPLETAVNDSQKKYEASNTQFIAQRNQLKIATSQQSRAKKSTWFVTPSTDPNFDEVVQPNESTDEAAIRAETIVESHERILRVVEASCKANKKTYQEKLAELTTLSEEMKTKRTALASARINLNHFYNLKSAILSTDQTLGKIVDQIEQSKPRLQAQVDSIRNSNDNLTTKIKELEDLKQTEDKDELEATRLIEDASKKIRAANQRLEAIALEITQTKTAFDSAFKKLDIRVTEIVKKETANQNRIAQELKSNSVYLIRAFKQPARPENFIQEIATAENYEGLAVQINSLEDPEKYYIHNNLSAAAEMVAYQKNEKVIWIIFELSNDQLEKPYRLKPKSITANSIQNIFVDARLPCLKDLPLFCEQKEKVFRIKDSKTRFAETEHATLILKRLSQIGFRLDEEEATITIELQKILKRANNKVLDCRLLLNEVISIAGKALRNLGPIEGSRFFNSSASKSEKIEIKKAKHNRTAEPIYRAILAHNAQEALNEILNQPKVTAHSAKLRP